MCQQKKLSDDLDDWLTALPEKHKKILQALQKKENFPELWAKYANVMQARYTKPDEYKKELSLARNIAIQAWQCDQQNTLVREQMEWAFSKQIPRWHYPLVQDDARNGVYRKALEQVVTSESIVFEIGTGSGILAMMAARAGAKHVYTCEMYPLVAAAARKNILNNGLADRITVIEKSSYDIKLGIDLPRSPDIFVAEIVDNSVLGEHVLPIMEDVWSRLLNEKTLVLPHIVMARGVLVGGDYWCRHARMGVVDGFDLSAFNVYAPSESAFTVEGQCLSHALSEPETLISFDFSGQQDYPAIDHEIVLIANSSGKVDGILRWMQLDFPEGIRFNNAPPRLSAWRPTLHFFPEPVEVKKGDEIKLRVAHDRKSLDISRVL